MYEDLIEALNTEPCTECEDGGCKTCTYRDYQKRAAATIEALEAEIELITAAHNAMTDRCAEVLNERDAARAERDAAVSAEVLTAIDELVEYARPRMGYIEWMGYANVLGEWRSRKEG